MATGSLTGVLQHLRREVPQQGNGPTDGQLLKEYLGRRDEAALAALVRRNAPMVWGVCRRILGRHHDAEDAFQATFLVLVRRAASIASPELLANWLHGVARQTSIKARATIARRKTRETQVADVTEPITIESDRWSDVQPLLDEELSRLPDASRIVIVLCDLEGKTRPEAARQLGLPEGTVGSRLARARVLLAKRLSGRGVALSGGVLATMLSQNASVAGVPDAVVSDTIRAANMFAAGSGGATGSVSVQAVALTEGVLKAMLMSKLKAVSAVALMLGLLATGATVLTGHTASAEVSQPVAAEQPMLVPEKPVQEKEAFTAWGKECNGLQAGLGYKRGQKRAYAPGETVTLVVRVRNVGMEDVKFRYLKEFFNETPPTVTDAAGKAVPLGRRDAWGLVRVLSEVTLTPGKEIEIADLTLEPRALYQRVDEGQWNLFGTGKFTVQHEQLAYATVDKRLSKLATGKLELDIRLTEPRDDEKKMPPKQEGREAKEPVTAWGKEINGLQAGLGFPVGENRAYHFGERVRIVARIRNRTKEAIEFEHIWAFFVENAPAIIDPSGKEVALPRVSAEGLQAPRTTKVQPGQTVNLYDWDFDLDSNWKANHGAGKYTLQCERIVGPTGGNPNHPNPKLEKLVTGKLELDVKDLTAWGLKLNGLQAGLGYRFGEQRAYAHREEVKIVLRIRNLGKEAVELKRNAGFFIENPPTVTNGDGKTVELPKVAAEGRQLAFGTTIAPGKEVELYEWTFDLRPAGESSKNLVRIHGTGRFILQCERVVGPTSGNPVHPHPALDKLVTGKLDLEVLAARKSEGKPSVKPDPEKAFTVWGKEVGGLQAGLRFFPGERPAAFHHGEKFKVEIKLRNVGKTEVKFTHGPSKEFTLAVTDIAGNAWTVAMPLLDKERAPPSERVIKPGETVTLAEPVVAVESTDVLKLKGVLRVDTPTMYVDSGNYKIAFSGLLPGQAALTTGPLDIAVRDLDGHGMVVDEKGGLGDSPRAPTSPASSP